MTEQDMVPEIATVTEIKDLTETDRFLKIKLAKPMDYKTGQFVMISIFGLGEVPISISSSPHVVGQEIIEIVVRNVGKITAKIHELKVNDKMGIRGPYSTCWPIEEGKGKNVVVIAGGIGLCPLRGAVLEFIRNKSAYKDVKLLYGAREPALLNFKDELQIWKGKIDTCLAVDAVPPDQDWNEHVGLIPTLFDTDKGKLPAENEHVLVCGPPIMIHFVCKNLEKRGIDPKNIFVSLERRMKCGVGKCGQCTVGNIHVCTDGPVFSLDQVKDIEGAVYLF
jgi:NAD(P)H-flavin reductase